MRIIYIDESGTIGVKKKEPYFIICAMIFDDEAALTRIKHVVKRAKIHSGMLGELHATKLNTAQKELIINNLTKKADYRIAYIVIDKNKISEKLYNYKNVTYNYLFGLLLYRVLSKINEDVRIISDSRTTKVTSANSLCDYIRAKAYGDWKFSYDISIDQAESHTHLGLQAADLIANTIFAKYNFGAEHLYNKNLNHIIISEKFPFKSFGMDLTQKK